MNSVVDALSSVLQDASPTGQLNAIRADGDTVKLFASDADGKQLPITITYLEASQYPRSGCLVLCEDDRYAEKLSKISASFQDSASLSGVLAKICAALDIPVDEEALRAADGRPNDDMEEDGSEAMSEDGSGYPSSDDGSDYGGGDSDDEDKELLIECGQRQGRWSRFEEELGKEESKAQVLSMEQGKASKRQIFSSKEAFKMLSNELLGFIRRQYEGASVSADSASDDVYTWNVELWKSAFKPGCQLSKDMQEVSAKWFVSSIQLRFSFMRGLHPFYPPRLEVVRPHLATPLPGALASHPLLRLDNWDPWLNMSQLLDNIKEFLEEYGSIDVHHPGNSTANNPHSAFSPVQLALARLEAITDVKPACYSQYAALYEARSTKARNDSPVEPQQVKKQKTDELPAAAAAPSAAAPSAAGGGRGVVWAKGVGYGYGEKTGQVWDPKAAAAAQAAQDEQLCELLQGLADALEKELAAPGDLADAAAACGSSSSAAAAAATTGSSGQQQQQDTSVVEPMAIEPTPQQQECLAAVQGSVLLPMLAQEFGKVAFPEMVSRHQYYQPLLAVLQALCRPVTKHLLAANVLPTQQPSAGTAAGASSSLAAQQQQSVQSVTGAVRGLVKGATMYRERMAKQLEEYEKQAAKQAGRSSAGAAAATAPKADKQTEALLTEARCSMQIADQLLAVVRKLQHLTTVEDAPVAAAAVDDAAARANRVRRTTRSSAAAAAAEAPQQQQQQDGAAANAACSYKAALKGLVLDSANIAARHKFKDEAAKDPMGLKKRVQKVTSEMAGIERLIDVSESSSIFVRVDEDNSFLWKVLITGPDDTPYSGGCFIFDMFFPPNYPNVPPKVLLVTTGNGSVRFNPNLYNCGKVCLSLLGTWAGGQGEGWNPDVSTAFQVLISIQSLILVPEPYFNEPGYEQRSDKTASHQYNQVIREACIRWAMNDQLQHPPAEFADVIRTHFRLRGSVITKQIQGWIDEASSRNSTNHASNLKALKAQFEALLAKLE